MKIPIRLFAVLLVLLCVALLPNAEAVIPPADGGYPGFNTAEGTNALRNLTTGSGNTAAGWYSLFSATTASFNTGVGAGTLALNMADQNTATGVAALLGNTTGTQNTATGAFALFSNTDGVLNTATGANALFSNTTGDDNVAVGYQALYHNTTGGINTAIGWQALFSNTEGSSNTATGVNVLFNNTTGSFNTASGDGALFSNTLGVENTAIGDGALSGNAIGNRNVAIGHLAGENVSTASDVICIGTSGQNTDFSCYIGNIYNQLGGIQDVYVNESGKLGIQPSSRRFKDEIKPIGRVSELIYGLEPVSFRYKPEIELTRPLGFGLIAEEVEKVSRDLVTRDGTGQATSVRYDAVNAMLLNEFLKEHRRVEEEQAAITELKSAMAQQRKDFDAIFAQQRGAMEALVARLNQQEAKIRRVTDQIGMNTSAQRVVAENR